MIHRNFRCEFYFIRHGESKSNATPGLAAGADFDAPLTERGIAQAKLLGQRFHCDGIDFDRIYSSSLKRTVKTARLMLDEMGQADRDFPKIDALIEQQMPGWRGWAIEDVYTPENRAYMAEKGLDFVPPEGESLRMVQRRVSSWIESEIIYNDSLTSKPVDLRVAVVGHGTASRCLFQYIMGFRDTLMWRIAIDNTSISRFAFDRRGWSVIKINDAAHLERESVSI